MCCNRRWSHQANWFILVEIYNRHCIWSTDNVLGRQLERRECLWLATYGGQQQYCSSRSAVRQWVAFVSGGERHVSDDDVSRLASGRRRRDWADPVCDPSQFLAVERVKQARVPLAQIFRSFDEVCKIELKRPQPGGEPAYAADLYWRPPAGTPRFEPWPECAGAICARLGLQQLQYRVLGGAMTAPSMAARFTFYARPCPAGRRPREPRRSPR